MQWIPDQVRDDEWLYFEIHIRVEFIPDTSGIGVRDDEGFYFEIRIIVELIPVTSASHYWEGGLAVAMDNLNFKFCHITIDPAKNAVTNSAKFHSIIFSRSKLEPWV